MTGLFPYKNRVALVFCCLAPLAASLPALAEDASIADLSLEELANLRVTTAALRPERLLDVPASVFVITHEDIRRSGVSSLPEALRLAPNLEVARVSATTYAISARGFQNVITNKMLVLIDGRTLYTTVLSGVLWDAQDVMLEDVERIEVISGPGAALFGANAFVGVINVITRSSRDSQGSVVTVGAGNDTRNLSARYGGKIGESGTFRFYGMHIERDGLRPVQSALADDMDKNVFGFRTDWHAGPDEITFQGDAYDGRVTGNGAPDTRISGANVLARGIRELAGGARVTLQAYYDRTKRDDPIGFRDEVETLDVEGQVDLPSWGAHKISVGAGYRYAFDRTQATPVLRFIPDERRLHWSSAFAQDEITLAPNLRLIAGAKVQTAIYVNPEFMPDLRLAWNLSPKKLAWVSASRVARTPGRVDRELFIPGNAPFFIRGGPDFQSETGNTFELGYRAQPSARLTYSITAFYTRLDQLRGGRLAPGGGAFISNEVEGATRGLEAWAMYQATERWRLSLGWLELGQDLRAKNGSGDLGGPAGLGNDPRHTVKLRSSWRLSENVDADMSWRYVSSLSYLTTVPAYNAADARIAWRVGRGLELSLAGTNLFRKEHVEFDEHGLPAAIPRTFYAQLRWVY